MHLAIPPVTLLACRAAAAGEEIDRAEGKERRRVAPRKEEEHEQEQRTFFRGSSRVGLVIV